MKVKCPKCQCVNDIELISGELSTCEMCGFDLSTLAGSLRLDMPTASLLMQGHVAEDFSLGKTIDLKTQPILYLGRFRIESVVGEGSSGCVYRAWDEKLGRVVALKVPNGTDSQNSSLFHEARALAGLHHPGIAQVYDVIEGDSASGAIVMEYVDGKSLHEQMSELGKIPPRQAAQWMLEVCQAVHCAHKRGFVHRDLKPSNIRLDAEGKVHVLDFGLALHESQAAMRSGEIAGTWPYMAPEQVRGDIEKIDGRCDIWAIGVILYEMLTGRRPFDGRGTKLAEAILNREPKPPRQLDESIPRALEEICLRCLAKDIQNRYRSAYEVAEDLAACLKRGTLGQRRRTGWLTVAVTVPLLAGATWALTLAIPQARQPDPPRPLWQLVGTPDCPIRDFSSAPRTKWFSLLDQPPILLFGWEAPHRSWSHHAPSETVTMTSDGGGFYLISGMADTPNYSLSVRVAIKNPHTRASIVFGLRPDQNREYWTCQDLVVHLFENRAAIFRTFGWGKLYFWPNAPNAEYLQTDIRHVPSAPIAHPGNDEHLLELKVEGNHVVGIWWDRQFLPDLLDAEILKIPYPWDTHNTNCQGLLGLGLVIGVAKFSDMRFRRD